MLIKSLKLLLVDMKANSSILMSSLELAGMAQYKKKCLIFIVVPWVRGENQTSWIG